MKPQEIEPPEELRNAIKCFWHTTLDFGAQPSDFEVLPDGYAEIILLPSRVGSHYLPPS
jgi:hypothetical protein